MNRPDRSHRLEVTLYCGDLTAHRQHIYTGFSMLAQQGLIRLRQVYGGHGVAASAGGRRAYFDVDDGPDISAAALAGADVYFKRSYSVDAVRPLDGHARIRPLGLNYCVFPDGPDAAGALRALRREPSTGRRIAGALRALCLSGAFVPRVTAFENPPQPAAEPRVLFLTRAWNPRPTANRGAGPSRQDINETRAACIRALRREFGARALAGFEPSPLVSERFPGLEAPVPMAQAAYLARLPSFPICVATTGLHGSIGWKMAEYVASARAIVTEPLNYCVPGFEAGQHYLPFESVDQCVEAVGALFDDRARRAAMMAANQRFYRDRVRPDRLVWNALTVLTGGIPAAAGDVPAAIGLNPHRP